MQTERERSTMEGSGCMRVSEEEDENYTGIRQVLSVCNCRRNRLKCFRMSGYKK